MLEVDDAPPPLGEAPPIAPRRLDGLVGLAGSQVAASASLAAAMRSRFADAISGALRFMLFAIVAMLLRILYEY